MGPDGHRGGAGAEGCADEPQLNAALSPRSIPADYPSHQPIDPRPLPRRQQTPGDRAARPAERVGRRVAEGGEKGRFRPAAEIMVNRR